MTPGVKKSFYEKDQFHADCIPRRFSVGYRRPCFSNDFLPVVEEAAAAGVQHFEAGGGALFQAAYFYSNEDAFTVMDNFRKAAGASANLQTLARGINVVGLDSQPRDIIRLHAQLMKKHGITTIRNFDALNDAENLIYSGKCIAEAGLHHEVTVTMMELPPGCQGHTVEFYESVLRRILNSDIPFHSIAFKDASGTSCPAKVYDTIKMARRMVGDKYPIAFHTHETAGCGVLCYKAALEGGADQIDLSIAPLSGGTCQPDVLTMWHALRGTEFSLDIDYRKIIRLEQSLKNALKDYFMPPEATKVDPIIPFCPMPGGALTANTQMLRDNGLMEKYHDIIEAMGETVSKGGFGTSVTPVSQFYFQQAFNNVMFGPWKKIAEGYGKMVLGYFGKTPGRPDPEVVRIASEQLHLEPTAKNPLDLNDANPAKGRKAAVAMLEANKLPITDENIFIAATCQEKGIAYLKGEGRIGVRKNVKNPETAPVSSGAGRSEVTVCINGKDYCVKFDKGGAVVNGVPVSYTVKENAAPVATPATAASAGKPEKFENLNAALPGIVLRMLVNPGDRVRADQAVMILESMKMETEVQSPVDGVLASFQVREGDQVQSGALLAVVKKV